MTMRTLSLLASGLLLAAAACSGAQNPAGGADSPPSADGALTLEATAAASQSVAYFAGGCFWCVEASFERLEGVSDVVSGYSGGHTVDPTYEESNTGTTGHAEAVAVVYDSTVIDYRTLLEVFFVAHDPTQLNRQGPDVGTQYRSAIFYETPRQLELIRTVIDSVNATDRYADEIVTEVKPFDAWYDAEAYHQNYYDAHPNQPYIRAVSRPKVEKVEREFAALLKEEYEAS